MPQIGSLSVPVSFVWQSEIHACFEPNLGYNSSEKTIVRNTQHVVALSWLHYGQYTMYEITLSNSWKESCLGRLYQQFSGCSARFSHQIGGSEIRLSWVSRSGLPVGQSVVYTLGPKRRLHFRFLKNIYLFLLAVSLSLLSRKPFFDWFPFIQSSRIENQPITVIFFYLLTSEQYNLSLLSLKAVESH